MNLSVILLLLISNPLSHATLYLYPAIYLNPEKTEKPAVTSTESPAVSEEIYNGRNLFQDEDGKLFYHLEGAGMPELFQTWRGHGSKSPSFIRVSKNEFFPESL